MTSRTRIGCWGNTSEPLLPSRCCWAPTTFSHVPEIIKVAVPQGGNFNKMVEGRHAVKKIVAGFVGKRLCVWSLLRKRPLIPIIITIIIMLGLDWHGPRVYWNTLKGIKFEIHPHLWGKIQSRINHIGWHQQLYLWFFFRDVTIQGYQWPQSRCIAPSAKKFLFHVFKGWVVLLFRHTRIFANVCLVWVGIYVTDAVLIHLLDFIIGLKRNGVDQAQVMSCVQCWA